MDAGEAWEEAEYERHARVVEQDVRRHAGLPAAGATREALDWAEALRLAGRALAEPDGGVDGLDEADVGYGALVDALGGLDD